MRYAESKLRHTHRRAHVEVLANLPQRCASERIGEAMGEAFVNQTFGADGKTKVLNLVHAVLEAFASNLEQLDWEKTKQ